MTDPSEALIATEAISSPEARTLFFGRIAAMASLLLAVAGVALTAMGWEDWPGLLSAVAAIVSGFLVLAWMRRVPSDQWPRGISAGWSAAGALAVAGAGLIGLGADLGGWRPQTKDDWAVILMTLMSFANSVTVLRGNYERQAGRIEET